MKDIFTYIAIFSLAIISFYYTEEVVNLADNTQTVINSNISNLDKYIVIDINNNDIETIYNIFKQKDALVIFAVNDKVLKDNEKIIEKIILEGSNVIYKGNNLKNIEKYFSMLSYLGYNANCIEIEKENKTLCNKLNLGNIEYKTYIEEKPLITIKKIINEEEYFVIKDSEDNINELGVVINFLKNKGYLIKAR